MVQKQSSNPKFYFAETSKYYRPNCEAKSWPSFIATYRSPIKSALFPTSTRGTDLFLCSSIDMTQFLTLSNVRLSVTSNAIKTPSARL